jgi:hypothetical protein
MSNNNILRFEIAGREYVCVKMNAFAANGILMKILGRLKLTGKDADLGGLIADLVSEDSMKDIVLPTLKASNLRYKDGDTMENLHSPDDIDNAFTVDTLTDFYEVAIKVFRFQFEDVFTRASARVGGLIKQ